MRQRTGRNGAALLATAAMMLGLLAGCTSGDSAGTGSEVVADEAGPDSGGAAADQAVAGARDDAEAQSEAGLRQKIVRAEVDVAVPDPAAAAEDVIALVTAVDGRVDERDEHRGTDGTESSARLVLRVPADDLDEVIDALGDVGTVGRVQQSSDDVTTTAQDLDARIHAMQISVARMEALLSSAASTTDLLSVESALSDRQASLESMTAQRDQLAEQVALSTLTVSLTVPVAGVVQESADPGGFAGGLAAGWDALVAVLGGLLVVLGAVLPWAALAALVLGAGLLVRQAVRRRQPVPVPVPVDRDPEDGRGPDVTGP